MTNQTLAQFIMVAPAGEVIPNHELLIRLGLPSGAINLQRWIGALTRMTMDAIPTTNEERTTLPLLKEISKEYSKNAIISIGSSKNKALEEFFNEAKQNVPVSAVIDI